MSTNKRLDSIFGKLQKVEMRKVIGGTGPIDKDKVGKPKPKKK